MNGGEKISRYITQLTVANFTGKWKKIQSGYFIATPRSVYTYMTETYTQLVISFLYILHGSVNYIYVGGFHGQQIEVTA